MQVRTVTLFLTQEEMEQRPKVGVAQGARLCQKLANGLIRKGWGVQTRRLATPPWTGWTAPEGFPALAKELELEALENGGQFISFGPIWPPDPKQLNKVVEAVEATQVSFFSAFLTGVNEHDARHLLPVARTMKNIGKKTPQGYGNLRFAGLANCGAGTPFFPTAFSDPAWQRPRVALGLEWCDVALKAFKEASAGDHEAAVRELRDALTPELWRLERTLKELAPKLEVDYGGLDVSLTPAIGKQRTAGHVLEALGCRLGGPGTVGAVAKLTGVLRRLPVQKCGYSGVMLPLLEDPLLVERARQGQLGLTELLLFSTVCGVGLDTVPLPGEVPSERLAALLGDLATIALRLNKPLSARLFLMTGKQAGELTEFESPYLYNGPVLKL